jgi:hypothetical protein
MLVVEVVALLMLLLELLEQAVQVAVEMGLIHQLPRKMVLQI